MRRAAWTFALLVAAPTAAAADPYRIRADALASVQSPAGLVTLDGGAEVDRDVHAEALLWFGNDGADALVADVVAQRGPVVARLGRFVSTLGAVRPVQLDGGGARVRLPRRFVLEAIGGVPVAPRMGEAAWDWVAGARVSRMFGDWGSVGVAWLQHREHGRLSSHELGVDGGAGIGKHTDVGGTLALDLIHGGVAEARLDASYRRGAYHLDVYGGERSPMRLIPATSLFSVLGDSPSRRAGVEATWRAAPRLDVRANLGGLDVAGDFGEDLTLAAELRLDDAGAGVATLELRREGAGDGITMSSSGGWTGARATVRVPLPHQLMLSSELELAHPDSPSDSLWPWSLVALSAHHGAWDAAAAVEASASPTERYRIDALARLGRRWGGP